MRVNVLGALKVKICSPSSALDGKSKFARLSRLKTSARSCRRRFSLNLNSLTTEKSTLLKSGPLRIFLPAVPRKPGTGGPKANGLNQRLGVLPFGGLRLIPEIKFGREALSLVASRSGSPSTNTVKGNPELMVTMELS